MPGYLAGVGWSSQARRGVFVSAPGLHLRPVQDWTVSGVSMLYSLFHLFSQVMLCHYPVPTCMSNVCAVQCFKNTSSTMHTAYTHTHTHTHPMHTHSHARTHTLPRTHTHTHTPTCTRTHTHTHSTKLFIRFPETLFKTEDLYQQKKHDLGKSLYNNTITERLFYHHGT